MIDIGNVKIEDLGEALLVLEIGDSAIESPFTPHCLCQALGVCQSRQAPVMDEALEFPSATGDWGGFEGRTRGNVFGEWQEVVVGIGVERDGRWNIA